MSEPVALVDPRPLALTVDARAALTPVLTQVTLRGDDLLGFEHAPGQDVMLAVPTDAITVEGGTINRRYTIRRADPMTGTLDLDIVVHGDGPGARWATAAPLGSPIAAVGPRGKVVPAPDVAWHLFACDESGLAATAAMVESLGPDVVALVVADVEGPAEHQAIDSQADLRIVWRDRAGGPVGDPAALVEGVAGLELPAGPGRVYLSAESAAVRAVADHLVARGVDRGDLAPKAYWRRGRANAAHGEPLRDDA